MVSEIFKDLGKCRVGDVVLYTGKTFRVALVTDTHVVLQDCVTLSCEIVNPLSGCWKIVIS